MLTIRITMIIIYKVLDCVQVAIGTCQGDWGVTSHVECTCTCIQVHVLAIDNTYF